MTDERVPVDRLRGGDVILIGRYGGDQPAQPTYRAYTVKVITPMTEDGKRRVHLALGDVPDDGNVIRTLVIRPDTTVIRRVD